MTITAKRPRHHRRLSLWGALPPYLGGKRRLCPMIFREIDRVIPRALWGRLAFLDGFLGGGSVSLFAKAQGFAVTSCDIAIRGITVGEALIANSRVKLTREDVLKLAAPDDAPAGRVEAEMAPSIFTVEQARFLDRCLRIAGETADRAKAALFRLMAIRTALLIHPMSQIRGGTIHRVTTGEFESITPSCLPRYVDGLRLIRFERLWELAESINAGVFQGQATIQHQSVLEALPDVQADIAYFDPPYPGVMSYEKEYRVLDQILEGQSRQVSPFTAKDGASMIDGLFERAQHIPVWLLSLGNAVVSLEELEAKMLRFGRTTRAIEIDYQHLPAVATDEKKATNREFLVIGWDEAALRARGAWVGEPRHDLIGGDLGHDAVAGVEDDDGPAGPPVQPAQGLGQNAAQELLPGPGQAAVGVLDPAGEAEGGVDLPDAVLPERSGNADLVNRIH